MLQPVTPPAKFTKPNTAKDNKPNRDVENCSVGEWSSPPSLATIRVKVLAIISSQQGRSLTEFRPVNSLLNPNALVRQAQVVRKFHLQKGST